MGWESRSPPTTVAPREGKDPPELLIRSWKGGVGVRYVGRAVGGAPSPSPEGAQPPGDLLLIVLSAAGISACGGGERQDADEPSGNFPVQIVSADFPSKQQLAQNTNLTLSVANTGDKTIPDLAITIFTASNASTSEL